MKITGKTPADGNTKDVEVAVLLKYLCCFWRTLDMPLINCEFNLILTWSADCVISSVTGETKFAIKDTKLYVPAVTLSIQDNAKMLQQLKSGFRRTINWKKYQSKVVIKIKEPYLGYEVDPSFQGVNILFVVSFENNDDRKAHTRYFLSKVEIKDYNIIINGQNQ